MKSLCPPLLLCAALGLSACDTPCSALREWSENCEFAAGRTVEENLSVCRSVRKEVGGVEFDRFVECVSSAECSELDAVDRCQMSHLEDTAGEPCADLRVWAAACGLEPIGTDNGCNDLGTRPTELRFGIWVDCVTANGCPQAEDGRYKTCGDSVLDVGATDLLDGCALVTEWLDACGPGALVLPIGDSPLPACITLAQPYTSTSYLAFARCLEPVACADVPGQLTCVGLLDITNRSQIDDQCADLVAFTDQCSSLAAGGSVSVCTQIFASFTAASMAAYSACLQTFPCGAAQAATDCATLLELQ